MSGDVVRRRLLGSLLVPAALCALVLLPGGVARASTAAADPLVGTWEVLDSNRNVIGVFAFSSAGGGSFATRVVSPRREGLCEGGAFQDADGQLQLRKVDEPGLGPHVYRGTWTVFSNPDCAPTSTRAPAHLAISYDPSLRFATLAGQGPFGQPSSYALRRVEQATLRVAGTRLTVLDRAAVLTSELRRETQRLVQRKNETEHALAAAIETAQAALAARDEVQRDLDRVEHTLAGTRRVLGRLAAIRQRGGTVPEADEERWLVQVGRLERRLEELRGTRNHADGRRAAADAAVQGGLQRRAEVDGALLDLGRRVRELRLEVREIAVWADRTLVYRALGDSATRKELDDLDERISVAEAVVSLLDRQRGAAKDTWLSAQRELVAAEARLAAVLRRVATGRFAVELVSQSVDFVLAVTKFGPVGILTEGAKKVVEGVVIDWALDKPGGTGSPVEAEIAKLYGAELRDAFSGQQVGYTVKGRVLKDTVGKAVRDQLNAVIADTVLAPTKTRGVLANAGLAAGAAERAARRAPTMATLRAHREAADAYARIARQLKAMRDGFDVRKGATGKNVSTFLPKRAKLLETLTKDLGKTALKGLLDAYEREAYVAFYEKDLVVRSLTPAFRGLSDRYWQAYGDLETLLERKGRILRRGFEVSGLKVVRSAEWTPGATLRVAVTFAQPPERVPLDVALLVDGARATRSVDRSRLVFTLPEFAPTGARSAAVTLEVR